MKIFSGKISITMADLAMLILRVAGGASIMTHGFPKLVKLLTVRPIAFADPIGLGTVPSFILVVFAEFFCGILLILGLFTRLAALALVINFSVIVFIVHKTAAFGDRELPVLFLVIFFSILLTGPGKYSLDKRIFK